MPEDHGTPARGARSGFRRQRVGVFGGTFDPPHVGHLVTAVNVRYELGLDRMLLMVANIPWQKEGQRAVSPAADRLALVQAAVAGVPGLEASALEIERGGRSFTADTLRALAGEEVELFTVLGSDAAAGIRSWERSEEVASLSTLVVVDRPGSSQALPDGFRWIRVEVPHLEVSSTELRSRVTRGRPLDYLVPDDVLVEIVARGMYRTTEAAAR